MKTKKLSKKMGLNKESIANLNTELMKKAKGGICMCKVYTCRTCLPGTCLCLFTHLTDCKDETNLLCPRQPY